jgi:predicted oxidoreductase
MAMPQDFTAQLSALLPAVPYARKLPQTDMTVSSLAWGCWRLPGRSADEVRTLTETALAAEITLFDTADIYGLGASDYARTGFGAAEAMLGEMFAAAPHLRQQIILATKGGITPPAPYDSSAEYIAGAIDASLKRLRTDTIDIWQIHRPDILTHPAEIAAAVDTAYKAGKIRSFGVSNYSPAQIGALNTYLTVPIVSVQPEFSPLRIDPITDGTLDQAIAMDMAVLAWSPLGGGRLTDPQSQRDRAVHAALAQLADAHDVPLSAAAYSWIMAHPAKPIPIIGTQNPARIIQAAAAYQVRWTRTDWYEVLVAARGETLP